MTSTASRRFATYLWLLLPLYFAVLGILYAFPEVLQVKLTSAEFTLRTIIGLLFMLPLLTRKNIVYRLCGFAFAIIWAYLLLAISDDFFDWRRGEDHYSNPGLYFGFGYTFITISLLCSALLAYRGIMLSKRKISAAE